MAEMTTSRRFPRLSGLWQNPVTIKELRSRMRGRRAFVVLTFHLLGMSGFITLVYMLFASASDTYYGYSPYYGYGGGPNSREAGKAIFGAVVGIQAMMVVFVSPSFTAGAITGEKERQTFSLLRTTLLPAHSIVRGKLVSSLSYVYLLILAAVPLQTIAFLLGGVSMVEVVIAELLLVVSAVAFALIGLLFSSLMRSTLVANISTFVTALFLTFGLPAMAIVIVPLGSSLFFLPGMTTEFEIMLIYTGLALVATNLPGTLIASELFLIQENSLFYFTRVIDGYTVYYYSPWYVFIALYTLLSLILYFLTVRQVRKVPKK